MSICWCSRGLPPSPSLAQGVANRDLKLENMLLDRPAAQGGEWPLIKICDFGACASTLHWLGRLTYAGTQLAWKPRGVIPQPADVVQPWGLPHCRHCHLHISLPEHSATPAAESVPCAQATRSTS